MSAEKIITDIDCYSNEFPKCPNCGYETYDYAFHEFDSQDEFTILYDKLDCTNCDQPFEVQTIIEYSFTTQPIGGWKPE